MYWQNEQDSRDTVTPVRFRYFRKTLANSHVCSFENFVVVLNPVHISLFRIFAPVLKKLYFMVLDSNFLNMINESDSVLQVR